MASTVPSRAFAGFERPLHILLVERDESTRSMYAEFLRLYGCVAEEAQDGREALAKAIAQRPDAIVTSLRLPGINGLDLCRVLRRDAETAAIPILVLSGEGTDTDTSRALRAGANSVLVKPCRPDHLASEIQQVLASAESVHPETRSADVAPVNQSLSSSDSLEPGGRRRRVMLNHVHGRRMTTQPSIQPPTLMCPSCYQTLRYAKSFIGGVSERHPEQWDYYSCPTGCGTFQYRHRTRKLRQIN